MSPPLTPDEAEANRQLAEELAKAIYARPVQSWLDDLINRVSDWLNDSTNGGGVFTQDQLAVAGLVGVVLLAAIVWVVLSRLRSDRTKAKGLSLDGDKRTGLDFRQAAADQASRGAWSEACLTIFRAMVRSLSERVIIDEFPGMTAKEATDRASTRLPGLSSQLAWSGSLFDSIAYGHRVGTAEHYQELLNLADVVDSTKPAPLADAPEQPAIRAEVVS